MTVSGSSATLDLSNADWRKVCQAIGDVFDELEWQIRSERPDLKSRGEHVQTARFRFVYRAFDAPQDRSVIEPLVVGIRFEPANGGVRVVGDIGTEESGHVLFDEGCERQVESATTQLAEIASDLARRLATQSRLILDYFAPSQSTRP